MLKELLMSSKVHLTAICYLTLPYHSVFSGNRKTFTKLTVNSGNYKVGKILSLDSGDVRFNDNFVLWLQNLIREFTETN